VDIGISFSVKVSISFFLTPDTRNLTPNTTAFEENQNIDLLDS